VVGEMGFFFGMRHITHARAHSSMPTTLFALPKADYNQLVKLYPDQVHHTQVSYYHAQSAPIRTCLFLPVAVDAIHKLSIIEC